MAALQYHAAKVMAHDVFVSHSSKDKTTADMVVAHLEEGGLRCWVAPRDIKAGASWAGSIVDAINSCRVMIVIFSSHANQSDHVRREVERAVAHGAIVVPLRVENVLPSSDLEYFLSSPHWLDAITPPIERHLETLVKELRHLLHASRAFTSGPDTAVVPPAEWQKAVTSLMPLPPSANQNVQQPRPRESEITSPGRKIALVLFAAVIVCAAIVALPRPAALTQAPSTSQVVIAPPIAQMSAPTTQAVFDYKRLRLLGRSENIIFLNGNTRPVDSIRSDAEAGFLDAQVVAGVLLSIGTNRPPSIEEAFAGSRLLSLAANAGSPLAMEALGNNFGAGTGVDKDLGKQRMWYDKAVDAGDPVAMTNIGDIYRTGVGVSVDAKTAAGWYIKAAEGGSVRAMTQLGCAYATGQGVALDKDDAIQWFKRAGAIGGIVEYREIAQRYESGRGVPRDLSEAFRWNLKAAASDDKGASWVGDIAKAKVGFAYLWGKGVAANPVAARSSFESVPRRYGPGSWRAQVGIGLLLVDGLAGFNKDAVSAHRSFSGVSERDCLGALQLAIDLKTGRGCAIDEDAARNALLDAAHMAIDSEDDEVLFQCAMFCSDRYGLTRKLSPEASVFRRANPFSFLSAEVANDWMNRSAQCGNPDADVTLTSNPAFHHDRSKKHLTARELSASTRPAK